jgi:class 3 adenylate cyclase
VRLSPDEVRPAHAEVTAGPLVLALENATPEPRLAILEGNVWPDTAATGALVGTFQEFRDLFSTEALAPGLQLGIENLAFMFTDLSGSTGLYQRVGQARAFRLVQDHFRLLGLAIARNRGAVVKTIGDAVMATFATPTDALAAALDIQRDIRKLEVPEGVDPARLVKIGIHQGPCVAVTLNDRLDYFGTTVNTAARIEPKARGGEIVASQVACQAAGALELLDSAGARVSEEIAELRGLTEPMPIVRIVLPLPAP